MVATGSCPTRPKEIPRIFAPSHCFVRFLPVLYRCGVAPQSRRLPHRQGAPLYRCQRSLARDWRHERGSSHGLILTHHGSCAPARENCFAAIVRRICNVQCFRLRLPEITARRVRLVEHVRIRGFGITARVVRKFREWCGRQAGIPGIAAFPQ
jgi:hypothetical protein